MPSSQSPETGGGQHRNLLRPPGSLRVDTQRVRRTLRRATEALRERGLIITRRGLGTFVAAVPTGQPGRSALAARQPGAGSRRPAGPASHLLLNLGVRAGAVGAMAVGVQAGLDLGCAAWAQDTARPGGLLPALGAQAGLIRHGLRLLELGKVDVLAQLGHGPGLGNGAVG